MSNSTPNTIDFPALLYDFEYSYNSETNYDEVLLKRIQSESSSLSCIDVGCGTGLGIKYLSKHYKNIFAFEISSCYATYAIKTNRISANNLFLRDFSEDISYFNHSLDSLSHAPRDVYSLFCTINYLSDWDKINRFLINSKNFSCGGKCIFQVWNSHVLIPSPPRFSCYQLTIPQDSIHLFDTIFVSRYTSWEGSVVTDIKTYRIRHPDNSVNLFTFSNLYFSWDVQILESILKANFKIVDIEPLHLPSNPSYLTFICS